MDDKLIVDQHLDRITEKEVKSFVKNLANKRLLIYLGKKLTKKEICSIPNVLEDILSTTRRLLPIYLWWADLSPREIPEDEAYQIQKSGSKAEREEAFSDPTNERKAFINQRVGQSVIRRYALERYTNQCALCDIKLPEMLEASHIVSWSEDEKNRGNPENIICLCDVHHKIFEKRFLFFTDTYETKFSKRYQASCENSLMLDLINRNTNPKLRLPVNGKPNPSFLRKHREK